MVMRTLALLAVITAGCHDQMSVVAEPGDIAVGARFRFAVMGTTCDESGVGSVVASLAVGLAFEAFLTAEGHPVLALPPIATGPLCLKLSINEISAATSSDSSTLAVVDTAVDRGVALIEVEARAAGSAEVRVDVGTAHGTESASATFRAAPVAHVRLDANCPSGTDEALIPIGATSGYSFALEEANGQRLLGFGLLPIEPAGLAFGHPIAVDAGGMPSADFRYLNITWPTTAGNVTLTSPDDAAFSKPVTVYDQSAYTSLDFVPGTGASVDISNTLGVRFDAVGRTGNRTTCWYDPIPRHFWTDTPTVCDLTSSLNSPHMSDLAASPYGAVVHGLAAGTCRLHAAVANTTFAPVIDIAVH
jgi:hypothetical protein